jgi:hypothetical protein
VTMGQQGLIEEVSGGGAGGGGGGAPLAGDVIAPNANNRVVQLRGTVATSTVEQLNGVAIDLANGTHIRQGGLVYVRPIGTGADDWPSLVALINANAYKYPVVMLPGTGGEAYQCLSDQQLAAGAMIIGTNGTVVQQPSAGSTLTSAAWQGTPSLGTIFTLDPALAGTAVGATSLILTAAPAVGASLQISIGSVMQGSIFTVRTVAATVNGTADITAGALYGGGGTLNGQTLNMTVNGVPGSITFNGATTSASEANMLAALLATFAGLATAVQGGTNGANAGKELVFTTTTVGGANITAIGGAAAATLGISAVPTDFLVTLDRPMNYALSSANPVTQQVALVTAQPSDIKIWGRGMRHTGPAGVSYLRISGANRCHFDELIADPSAGSLLGLNGHAFQLGLGSLDTVFVDCYSTNVCGDSVLFIAAERCGLVRFTAMYAAVTGGGFVDCIDCYATDLLCVANGTNGFAFASSSTTGCVRCSIKGGKFYGNQIGFKSEFGSTDCTLTEIEASFNTLFGLELQAAGGGTTGIAFTGLVLTGNTLGFLSQGGVHTIDGMVLDRNVLAMEVSAGLVTASEIACTDAPNSIKSVYVTLTGQLRIKGATFVNTSGASNILVDSTGTLVAEQVHNQFNTQGIALELEGSADGKVAYWTFVDSSNSTGLYVGSATAKLRVGAGMELDQVGRGLTNAGNSPFLSFQQSSGLVALADGNPTLTWAQSLEADVLEMTPTANRTITLMTDSAGRALPGLHYTVFNGATLVSGFTLTPEPSGGTGPALVGQERAFGYINTANAYVKVTGT